MGAAHPTRILCLGDSLTEGMSSQRPGRADNPAHPYANQLQQHLSMPIEAVNAGHSGFTAQQILDQLERELTKAGEEPFEVIIVMAGTNDLLTQTPAYILSVLRRIWQRALKSGCSYVVALPVLEVTFDQTMMRCQKQLNRDIRIALQEYLDQDASIKGKLCYYDLCSAFPQDALTDADRTLYWSDPVHPTAEGYDRIAELIGGSFLEPLLASEFKWTSGRDKVLLSAFEAERQAMVDKVSTRCELPKKEVEARLAALGMLAAAKAKNQASEQVQSSAAKSEGRQHVSQDRP